MQKINNWCNGTLHNKFKQWMDLKAVNCHILCMCMCIDTYFQHTVSHEIWNGSSAGWLPAYCCGNPATDGKHLHIYYFILASHKPALFLSLSLADKYTHLHKLLWIWHTFQVVLQQKGFSLSVRDRIWHKNRRNANDK